MNFDIVHVGEGLLVSRSVNATKLRFDETFYYQECDPIAPGSILTSTKNGSRRSRTSACKKQHELCIDMRTIAARRLAQRGVEQRCFIAEKSTGSWQEA